MMQELDHQMYDFLIEPLRREDEKRGNLFVQRFLQGAQTLWEQTRAKILSLPDLWDVLRCPDEYLQYLKNIVGWTKKLEHITDGLDYLTLRRLIAFSSAMWKSRSTENTIIDLLFSLAPARARIWNWFDLRWILDETIISEEHQGRDPWVFGDTGPYTMNVRVVDNPLGTVDRDMLKGVLGLMRPVGERFEIIYLHFLDQFLSEGDTTQWVEAGQAPTTDLVVSGGRLQLVQELELEGAMSNVEENVWTGYMLSTRLKCFSDHGYFTAAVAFWHWDDISTKGYYFQFNSDTQWVEIGWWDGDVGHGLTSFYLYDKGIAIAGDQWFFLRVQIVPVGGTNEITVWLDGVKVAEVTDAHYMEGGGIGFAAFPHSTLECSEVEVMPLPV